MPGIFISYRREDSSAYAGRLYDRLSARFGADQVFMDVDDIPPGADFAAHIDAKVGSCDAMVVVIGKDWLSARNAQGQLRLSDPSDFVGLEVAMALQRDVFVVPVLVGGAPVPKEDELRADLKGLARRNALTLNDQDFQRDADNLIGALEKLPNLGRRRHKELEERRTEFRKKRLRRLIWKVPLILLLISFAVWWEQRRQQPGDATEVAAAAAVTGAWAGEVTYGWGAKHNEPFFFQPEGNRLFGTAGFLGVKRGIEEGKIFEGGALSFVVRFEEVSGGESRQRKNTYWGKLNGRGEILIRMQDDRGNPAVEWVLRKSAA
jgi:TIR domain-containing protein